MRAEGAVFRAYLIIRFSGGLAMPPTVTTTGCTPGAAFAGTVTVSSVIPNNPDGTPKTVTLAATPPTVTLTGRRGLGAPEAEKPKGGVAPVARNEDRSPSPVISSARAWPALAETMETPELGSRAKPKIPGAATLTGK